MRLFLAVNLPDDVRDGVASATQRARATHPGVAWVQPSLLHLTVKFIGERNAELVPRVVDAARAAAAAVAPFESALAGGGAFPNFRAPRVVWIGMANASPLVALAARLDAALVPLGIPAERRPFRPHLTLGRVRRALSPDEGEGLAREMRALAGRWPLPITHVDLMRSELSSAGPRYTSVATFALGRP